MNDCYWAILDRDGRAIGGWIGPLFHVNCFPKRTDAKLVAIALKIPNYQVVPASEAIRKLPSPIPID